MQEPAAEARYPLEPSPEEMRSIGGFIARGLESVGDEVALDGLRREVEEMASAFPVPGITDRAGVNA